MEIRKNLRVLPSNAPALSESTGNPLSLPSGFRSPLSIQTCQNFNRGIDCRICGLHHVCSICRQPNHGAHECKAGVLQVSSGNAGPPILRSNVLESKLGLDNRCELRVPSLFANPPLHSAQAAIKLDQRKDRRRRTVFHRSELQSPRYVAWELQSPRYLAYRQKAGQKSGKDKDDVWPDSVEEAFQIALRLFAGRGRTKKDLNGKQSGGNEFISDYILKKTGTFRSRKQVSSHIQVLKSFLQDVPAWMNLVTAWPDTNKKGGARQSQARFDEPAEFENSTSSQYAHALNHRTYHNARPPPPAEGDILGSNVSQGRTIRRVQFEINLFNETNVKIHTYTSIQSEIGSAAQSLDHVSEWRTMFPQMAAKYDQGQVQCPLFLFETRLRLMDDYREGSSLGIELAIDFAEGAHYRDWRSLTRFHKRNITPQYFEDTELEQNPWNHVEHSESITPVDTKLMIPFKSTWWVKLFSSIIRRRLEARETKDLRAIRAADEYARHYLSELSVMQELWATPRTEGAQPQRMAILLWKFSQTRHGEAATTSWRPLDFSGSSYQATSPPPRLLQPPMDLDSSLQDNGMTLQVPPPYGDFYGQQPSIFAENSESLLAGPISSGNSSATTPIVDVYRSFPSSTSTSFPSSISNSTYATHPSQPSSYDTQDSSYSFPDSFDGQNAAFHSQDLIYHSQNPAYDQVADYSSFEHNDNDPTIVGSHSDFAAGEIHLSYDQPKRPLQPQGYEAPLIAPRVNALPPSQIGHHLEQFENYVQPASRRSSGHHDDEHIHHQHQQQQQQPPPPPPTRSHPHHHQQPQQGLHNAQWSAAPYHPALWANMNFPVEQQQERQ